MKGNFKLAVLLLFSVLCASCTKQNADEGFSLRYFGVTQIGPNLTVLLTPYFNNGTPGNFEFVDLCLDGEPYANEGNEFSINAENGVITVSAHDSTLPGRYTASVRCVVGGRSLSFADVLDVHMMKGVPDGIKLDPSTASVDIMDLDASSTVVLPSPVVTTEGDHVKISSYVVQNVRWNDAPVDNVTNVHFTISQEGVLSIVKGAPFKVDTYAVDLKLNTACYGSDSQEGFFANAFVLDVVSAPQSFAYSPSSGIVEEEASEGVKTSFASAAPVMVGSPDEVVWSIAGVTPACDKIAIDPETGVISIAEGHGLLKGANFLVDVNVKNKWSKDDGLTVPSAYAIEVVEFIYPISGFGYPASSKKFATSWKVSPSPETQHVRSYAFAEPTAEYVQYLTLDPITGEVTAAKGNQMPQGSYEVKIAASNGKDEPTVASLNLTVEQNPYYFTYFAYGNNLDLTEAQTKGASQFRVKSAADLTALGAEVKFTDLEDVSKASWKISAKNQLSGTSIDGSGKITFSGYKSAQCGVAFVTATTLDPDDSENTFSVTLPVFVDMPAKVGATTVTFTPFVLRVNPQKGGRSVAAQHPDVDAEMFRMDYRRTFNYWNLNGVRSDGTPHESGALTSDATNAQYFLQHLWNKFTKDSGISTNFGSKNTISYYNGNNPKTSQVLDVTPAYVDNAPGANQFTLCVNPLLWYDDGWADGVFMAQMTYVTDGNVANINSASQRFPIALWLDKDFEE